MEGHGLGFILLTALGLLSTSKEGLVEAQKSINEIKEELRAAEETMLPTFKEAGAAGEKAVGTA